LQRRCHGAPASHDANVVSRGGRSRRVTWVVASCALIDRNRRARRDDGYRNSYGWRTRLHHRERSVHRRLQRITFAVHRRLQRSMFICTPLYTTANSRAMF
jgi:hypothetical protein